MNTIVNILLTISSIIGVLFLLIILYILLTGMYISIKKRLWVARGEPLGKPAFLVNGIEVYKNTLYLRKSIYGTIKGAPKWKLDNIHNAGIIPRCGGTSGIIIVPDNFSSWSVENQLVTLAHELGHLYKRHMTNLAKSYYSDFNSDGRSFTQEVEADVFAATLMGTEMYLAARHACNLENGSEMSRRVEIVKETQFPGIQNGLIIEPYIDGKSFWEYKGFGKMTSLTI